MPTSPESRTTELAQWLADLRGRLGKTQAELAAELGAKPSMVSMWEGATQPTGTKKSKGVENYRPSNKVLLAFADLAAREGYADDCIRLLREAGVTDQSFARICERSDPRPSNPGDVVSRPFYAAASAAAMAGPLDTAGSSSVELPAKLIPHPATTICIATSPDTGTPFISESRGSALPPESLNSAHLHELAKKRAWEAKISYGEALDQVAAEHPEFTVLGNAAGLIRDTTGGWNGLLVIDKSKTDLETLRREKLPVAVYYPNVQDVVFVPMLSLGFVGRQGIGRLQSGTPDLPVGFAVPETFRQQMLDPGEWDKPGIRLGWLTWQPVGDDSGCLILCSAIVPGLWSGGALQVTKVHPKPSPGDVQPVRWELLTEQLQVVGQVVLWVPKIEGEKHGDE